MINWAVVGRRRRRSPCAPLKFFLAPCLLDSGAGASKGLGQSPSENRIWRILALKSCLSGNVLSYARGAL